MTMNEGFHVGEFLLSEGNGEISREVVNVTQSGAALASGTVLGMLAGGSYVPYDNAGTGGAEVAKAILYSKLEAASRTVKAVVIARDAEVQEDALTGYDSNAKADLAAVGIIVR